MPPGLGHFLLSLASATRPPSLETQSSGSEFRRPIPPRPQEPPATARLAPSHASVPAARPQSTSAGGGAARLDKSVLPGTVAPHPHFTNNSNGAAPHATPGSRPRAFAWGEWAGSGSASAASSAGAAGCAQNSGCCGSESDSGWAHNTSSWDHDWDDWHSDPEDWADDDEADNTQPTCRPGELWAAAAVYPAGICSMLDEENLHAAREYSCTCGKACLSRVSFIDLYEVRKESVRYVHVRVSAP